MITALTKLLALIKPSLVIEKNCIELIQREQVGTKKYGVTLTDAKLTHAQVLQHLLEEQLDAANYTRKALMTIEATKLDYDDLRNRVNRMIKSLELLADNQLPGDTTLDTLRDLMFRHDLDRLKRDVP